MESVFDKKAELFTSLIQEVEETFGRRVSSSRDCILLSEEIYFRTSFKINANTLRRFFGLVKAEYPASKATLNILSKYCGFESFDDLLAARKTKRKSENIQHAKELLDYLVNIFKTTHVKNYNDETFLSLVKQTIQFLQKYPELTDKFQREVARTKNGQEFYFEQFVNIDKLNSFYGEGLRYYLNEKKTLEAQIFGYALLCLKAWLINDKSLMKKYFGELTRHKPDKTVHPFVCGRYYASHLYFAEMNGLDMERILIDAQHSHNQLKPGAENYQFFPCFEYMFSVSLVLTGHYDDGLYYINYAFENYPGQQSYLDKGFYKTLNLLKAIILFKTGKKNEAEKIFNQLRPSQFYFLSKKVNTILYIRLAFLLNKGDHNMKDQLSELIQSTGYIKFETELP